MSDKEIENILVSLSEFTCDDLDISFDKLVDETLGYINRLKERIADLEDKIENGTLVELPCNKNSEVGGTVYVVYDKCSGRYCIEGSWRCGWSRQDGKKQCEAFIDEMEFDYSMLPYMGKTIFTDKSQAEERLKELKGDN